jgi:hypothetical protein
VIPPGAVLPTPDKKQDKPDPPIERTEMGTICFQVVLAISAF